MHSPQPPQSSTLPTASRVQLRRASLPFPFGWLAVHCWFTLLDPTSQTWHRWEVWQTANAGGTGRGGWGHVHLNLMQPDAGIGGNPCVLVHEWSGDEARRLADLITHPLDYPHRLRYRPWPGPNSNTYVSWILRQAAIACPLTRKALGKNYR